MSMNFYANEKDLCTAQVLVAAALCDIKLNLIKTTGKNIENENIIKNRPDSFFPALDTKDGYIYGSIPIVKYISKIDNLKELDGQSFFDKSNVDNFLCMSLKELEKSYYSYLKGELKCVKQRENDIEKICEYLDKHLCLNTYLASNNVTIADTNVCTAIFFIIESKMCKINMQKYANLNRWYNTVKQSVVAKVLMEQKPDVDEEKLASKVLDDLVSLSEMDLDAWKREYSNSTDIKETSMKYFWEHFDKDNWCIYKIKYKKLEDECNILITTINQLGGFMQRIHPSLRKHSFGVFLVTGAEKSYDIKGVMMFRGKKIPSLMRLHPSFEFHSKKKLDVEYEKDKQTICDYFCAGRSFINTLKGVPIVEAKVWK